MQQTYGMIEVETNEAPANTLSETRFSYSETISRLVHIRISHCTRQNLQGY